MNAAQPRFLVMAGPNGVGKPTCAARFLPTAVPSINADDIAKTLTSEPTHETEIQAARIALGLKDEAESRRETFATEATLASRTLASRAIRLQAAGYQFRLFNIWTTDPDFSISRVARRVRLGGHDIPEATIRRRWLGGLGNFFSLYQPIADQWQVIDNATSSEPQIVASGPRANTDTIHDRVLWDEIKRRAEDAT